MNKTLKASVLFQQFIAMASRATDMGKQKYFVKLYICNPDTTFYTRSQTNLITFISSRLVAANLAKFRKWRNMFL